MTQRLASIGSLVTKAKDEERPYLALEHVISGEHRVVPDWDRTPTPARESGVASARPGDVLFGKLRPYLRKSLLVTEPIHASTELLTIRPAPSVDPLWLSYLVQSDPFVAWSEATSTGSKMPRTSWEKLREFRLEIPPRPKQAAIAKYLDTEIARISNLIAVKKRQAATHGLQTLVKVRKAVTQGVQFHDPLGVCPSECLPSTRPMRLSWLFSTGSGTTPRAGDERFYGSGTPWVTTSDLRDNRISGGLKEITEDALSDYSALHVHPAGSLVIAMYGATIGRLGLLEIPATVNQACCVLAPLEGDSTEFVFYWLWAHRAELIQQGMGAGQPNISAETIRSIRIAFPSEARQRLIVREIQKQVELSIRLQERLERQIRLLGERRRTLITAMVTGELEV